MSAPAPSAALATRVRAFASVGERLSRRLAPGPRASAWRSRLPLILGLSALLAAGIAVLVTYHGFWDARFRALDATRAQLVEKRDEAKAAAEKVKATELRLRNLQKDLEEFNRDVLGTRKERLAALIEDVYALTQKAGLVPSQISYALGDASGVERLALTFAVMGRYADVKRLLYAFETNPRLLVLESVGVATDDREPDVLRLNLVVAHYFRPDGSAPRRPARGVPRASRPAAAPATASGAPE